MTQATPPLVFLPGLLETRHIWHALIDRLGLAADRVMLVDLPGHVPGDGAEGVTQALTGPGWLSDLAQRVRLRFDGAPVTVVGHSTGGLLALQLAARHPDLVDSVVAIGALTKGDRGLRRDPGAQIVSTPMLGPAAFRTALSLWLASPDLFQRGYALAAAQRRVKVPAPEAMRQQLRACDPMALYAATMGVLQADAAQDVSRAQCPILAVIGTSDPVVPPEHQIGILRQAPNAVAQMVPAGHLPFAECPERIASMLRAWQLGERAAPG